MGAVLTNRDDLQQHLFFQQLGQLQCLRQKFFQTLRQCTQKIQKTLFSYNTKIICRELLEKKLESDFSAVGAIPSPFDCYLVNRGIKTLHLRMKSHYENAMAVALFLEADARVEKVRLNLLYLLVTCPKVF